MIIWHNNRCTKSRQTLALLEKSKAQVEVVNYLKNPPSREELKDVLDKLNMEAKQIVRRSEQVFKTNYFGKTLSEEEWLDVLVKYPILIERPIVIKGNKAVIGRPPENVLVLL